MTPQPLVLQDGWQVLHLPGDGQDLVMSFSSIGHDPTRPPSPEFLRSATAGNRPALFIIDAARSWATAPGFALALTRAFAALGGRSRFRRILALGVSMGGFAALRSAEVLPVDAVLAVGPQFRPTEDSRWQNLTRDLPAGLTAPLAQGTRVTLFHGTADDCAQALGFPLGPGVDHLLFPGLSHSALAPHLKARGLMEGLIASALARDRRRLIRLAVGAGGVRRQLPR